MTDTYLAAVASKERAKGLAHVRDINNEWRAEVDMPRRRVEEAYEATVTGAAKFAESLLAVERYSIPFRYMAGVFNPGAWDGRNSWEDEPAPIYDQLQRERGTA